MNLPDLEREALNLPPAARARLAEALLESLEILTVEENRVLWIEEARQRDAEFDSGSTSPRSAEAVFRGARERLG